KIYRNPPIRLCFKVSASYATFGLDFSTPLKQPALEIVGLRVVLDDAPEEMALHPEPASPTARRTVPIPSATARTSISGPSSSRCCCSAWAARSPSGRRCARSCPGAHTVSLGLTFGVLGAGFVFELASFVVAYRSLRHEKGEATFREYWRDTRDPTLPTVLLEDSAALVSLVVAAVGI